MPPRRRRGPPPLVAYVLPAVVGRGGGDVEEVRAAAWIVHRAGIPVRWFGPPGTPRTVPVTELEDWPVPGIERALRSPGARALTLSSQFGVTAEGPRPFPLGAAGPWWPAVAALERAYDPARVLHVSLEEFARNLPAAAQERERLREGGRSAAEQRAVSRTSAGRAAVARMRRLFERFHVPPRRNLIALFPTYRTSRGFQREFPRAVQCGPIPPPEPPLPAAPARSAGRGARWLWYASPGSSERLIAGIVEGAARAGRPLEVRLRAGPPSPGLSGVRGVRLRPVPRRARAGWRAELARADVRVVTGSRSLIEAQRDGAAFLYFNGVTGRGRATRRHRPEKLDRLLAAARAVGLEAALARDLTDFARGRRVAPVVARLLAPRTPSELYRPFRAVATAPGAPPPATPLIEGLVRAWAAAPGGAPAFLAGWRRAGARRVR